MIAKNIVKLPKAQVEVTITVPWTDLEGKWNETLQRLASDMELPGFRKGQIPLNLVEQNLGNKLQDEFLKTIMPQLLVEALQGENIVPIDYPKYQLTSFVKGGQLVFKAQISERPEVKIGDYKNIQVLRPPLKIITDEDVNKLVDELCKRWKTRQPSFAKATEEQIPAATQPQTQSSGSLSFNSPGQPLQAPSSDTPDEEFAKAVGAQSLEDLKIKLKTDLEREAKFNNELDFEELILQQVEKLTSVEVPEILIEDELNRMLVSLQRRVADMGLLLEDYLKSQNPSQTVDDLRKKWREQAERNVRMELGLAEIARQEKVEITDQELQTEIDKVQDARLKAQFEAQEPRLHLRHSLRQMKTLDFLKNLGLTP